MLPGFKDPSHLKVGLVSVVQNIYTYMLRLDARVWMSATFVACNRISGSVICGRQDGEVELLWYYYL